MGQHLLKDVLGTRYFYVSIDKDFTHVVYTITCLQKDPEASYFAGNDAQEALFQDVKAGNPITIDIREMRITSDCTLSINNAMLHGIQFVDTKSTRRNAILQESAKRHAVDNTVNLPIYNPVDDPVEYIKSLDKNVVYKLPAKLSKLDIALIILATMTRPKLQFAMENNHGVILDQVADVITLSVLCKYTEFYYHSPEGIEVLKMENGLIYTQRRGLCSLAEACEAGSLVPTALGREKLIRDPDWEPLVTLCLSALNASRQSRPKTLREVLKGVS